jgi:hypothetical protein
MTHEQIIKHRTGKESQYGYLLAQEIRLYFRSGNSPVNSIWDFQAPGISVCQGGRSRRQTDSSSRPKDCLHGEGIGKPDTGIAAIRTIQGSNVKRSGHRGLDGLAPQRLEAWSGRGKRNDPLSWNIVLTGCHQGRSASIPASPPLQKLAHRPGPRFCKGKIWREP